MKRLVISPVVGAAIGALVGFGLVLFFALITGEPMNALTWDFIEFFGKAWAVIGAVIGFVAGLIRAATRNGRD
jgi:gas vesicle protein